MRKGQKHSDETRAKMSAAARDISEETREKMRQSALRRAPFSDEARAKMSAAAKARKRKPPSEETRRKISEAQRGKFIPPETRAKMSAAHKGVPWTEAQREAIMPTRRYGSDHPMWKGDDVGYVGLHAWLTKHYGKTGVCEECGAMPKRTEWANIDGIYGREREHYRELCVSCHRRRDSPKN